MTQATEAQLVVGVITSIAAFFVVVGLLTGQRRMVAGASVVLLLPSLARVVGLW